MNYTGIPLCDDFHIDTLYSLHYFEYMSSFAFPGEAHDFWEFVCVDKGEVLIGAEDQTFLLKRGQVFFHRPGEFHRVNATGSVAPNLIVVSFSCSDPLMDFFSGRLLRVNEYERRILARMITEARNFLDGRLDDPYQTVLTVRESAPACSGQLIRIFLEEFLISLYRRFHPDHADSTEPETNGSPEKLSKEKSDDELFAQITAYFEQNLSSRISIGMICRDHLVSRSRLQKVFQKKCGSGIMEYFMRMKVDAARQMIRDGQMNFTQISEKLGYSSIHYFSRQFKKLSGMTPTEYASSIMAISQIED